MALALSPVSVAVAGPLRAGVHVVTRNDMHPDVRRRAASVDPLPPRYGHRSLAAAVVEQAHVRTAEVPVRQTVDHIVEAGFGQTDPGRVVEDPVRDTFGGPVRQDHAERQPKQDED